ncbi:hypothetical protein AK812_SmicGene15435 [Symbiodinium microadriaticum]|uniref:Uncharacterized protein n=1 Tax=Symbiodinium microadriaticum TaxID=2951 RepID=A0A1Q9E2V5_SYMMI|nr:hypothetical protein AK812_SmicGene15435 [Symbiodinium microadriaticum]
MFGARGISIFNGQLKYIQANTLAENQWCTKHTRLGLVVLLWPFEDLQLLAMTLTGIAGGLLGGAAAFTTANWDVVGMTSGLATSGRGAQVDQSFQRKHDRIDYKVQRQSLHRDDLNDLMGLTIGRMDMYNLVGALLLTFALQWITSSDIVAAPDVKYWPPWYSTVFVISCFSSVGYLLFSLWFAMMCSVTCQSLGTRLRINFARQVATFKLM